MGVPAQDIGRKTQRALQVGRSVRGNDDVEALAELSLIGGEATERERLAIETDHRGQVPGTEPGHEFTRYLAGAFEARAERRHVRGLHGGAGIEHKGDGACRGAASRLGLAQGRHQEAEEEELHEQ